MLNIAIKTQVIATKGLSLSPITAALLINPKNPCCPFGNRDGWIAFIYDAVHITNSSTISTLSKLKNPIILK